MNLPIIEILKTLTFIKVLKGLALIGSLTWIIGSIVWIKSWWKNRIISTDKLCTRQKQFETRELNSIFRRVSGLLTLDMTYLTEPTDVNEDVRSHSFRDPNGYFAHLKENKINNYEFIFFEKNNSDRKIVTTVDIEKQKIVLKLSLKRKGEKRFMELFSEEGFKFQKLSPPKIGLLKSL